MSDYSIGSKNNGTTIYPVHANGTSGLLKRVEPLVTPSLLKSRHLKGIFERLPAEFQMNNTELKDQINLAVNELEIELNVPIFAEQFRQKLPYDPSLYRNFIHLVLEKGPIVSIEDLAIVTANHQNIFRLPADWIETANFHQKQINVIPLLAAYGANQVTGSVATGGIAFLTVLGGLGWVPAYWQVVATIGMCKDAGTVPVVVNQVLGTIAAINILSGLALAHPNNSISLSQDGLGQSSSNAGVQMYAGRIADLQLQRQKLIGQIKKVFGSKYFLSNI